MKQLIIFLNLILSFSAFAVTEKACQRGQDKFTTRMKYHAAVAADKLIVAVRQNLQRSDLAPRERRKLHLAGNILHCARGKLGTLKFVCADGLGEQSARTYPFISRKVYLADYFFEDNRPRWHSALLLHEATHHCGTNDARYFDLNRRPTDGTYVGWQTIADTYQYWAEYGFCLPGSC